jgi:hypothetical protein
MHTYIHTRCRAFSCGVRLKARENGTLQGIVIFGLQPHQIPSQTLKVNDVIHYDVTTHTQVPTLRRRLSRVTP